MPQPIIAWKPAAATPELASARLRCFRPLEYLNADGWACEIFDSTQMHRYRVVVFQKAYSANDIDTVLHLRRLGVRTVFDLCDNHFFNATARSDYEERADRLRRMVDAVDSVSVATPELAALIDRPTSIIDDALDTVESDWWATVRRGWPRRQRPLRLVWFGNAGQDDPPFGLIDLERVRPSLEALHARRPIGLTVISNSRATFDRRMTGVRFPISYHEWDSRRYQRIVRRQDLCLIPVSLNPFTRCKTVNRLALSLLLGVPAVADSIPSYDELRPFALFNDWGEGLAAYVVDAAIRRAHVRAGQAFLKAKYTPRRVIEQWSAVLRPLAA